MLFGAHVSAAGGLHRAFDRVEQYQCECLQVFTKSQLQWEGKPLTREAIGEWKRAWREHGNIPCTVHGAYLVNLSTPDKDTRAQSVEGLIDEIRRAHSLGIRYVITHPGSHRGAGEEEGLRLCEHSLREVLRRTASTKVTVLLENTAGQGHDLGWRFEHLGILIKALDRTHRIGVCIDTCHAFAAGYDFRTAQAYENTWQQFDEVIGIDHLHAFHLNDSKFPLGSHRDRHEAIGKGEIGAAGFRRLVNDERFRGLPGSVELKDELVEPSLNVLRKLRKKLP